MLRAGLELLSSCVCGPVRAARVTPQGPAAETWTRSSHTSRTASRCSYSRGQMVAFPAKLATSCIEYEMPGNGGLQEGKHCREITLSYTWRCAGHSMTVEEGCRRKEPRETESTGP